jgi:hypothetical protein
MGSRLSAPGPQEKRFAAYMEAWQMPRDMLIVTLR